MKRTSPKLRNLTIYQVFVRNHTPEGDFAGLRHDLDRIRDLGVDFVYLLPIHPIGVKNRKGSLGSPYSIRDYREINPEYGTMADFQTLVDDVHAHGMKLMIDVVFNHTSRDSRLLMEHPEWFYRNEKGDFANRVGEWWDVTDFDFRKDKALWVELADTLRFYAQMGVDGFRCDVASLVPVAFWTYARKIVAKVNPRVVWLSESVHGGFVKYIRDRGFDAWSEAEVFQAFDMAYDYDVQPFMEQYLKGARPLREYLEALRRQEEIYPRDYVKMHNVENHDNPRIAALVGNDPAKIRNWHAFTFFLKGSAMVYAGAEYSSDVRSDLFEKDPIVRKDDISGLIRTLAKLKKRPIFANGVFDVVAPAVDGVAITTFEDAKEKIVGIFNLGQVEGSVAVPIADGRYRDLLGGRPFRVEGGAVVLGHDPVAVRIAK
ncbi:MAG: alpha-amylase family glycosyl hydrolase [Candidatus Izemoplasmatales bacterium]